MSNPSQWKWVPSKLNSADIATRGLTVSELSRCNLWWNGPEYLCQSSSTWHVSANFEPSEVKVEIREKSISFIGISKVIDFGRLDPSRYSNWLKLIRVTAWILRFIRNCKNVDKIVTENFIVRELEKSKSIWYRTAQNEEFSEEIKCVEEGKNLSHNSKLLTFNPKFDEFGVLRVNGRLCQAENLSYQSKHPVILPSNHVVSRLIVKFYHDAANHEGGVSYIPSQIRTEYWVIHAREVVKSVQAACNECKRRKCKPAQQQMAPLPAYRISTPLRAFARTGIDFAGPFVTKQSRGRVRCKRYLCLFTCMTSRAVHLEMAWALDTDSFLSAFSRFTSRRGKPIQVLSDNGTNFIGADRELKLLLKSLDETKIGDSLSNRGIEWNFNPPLSPNFGGIFEAMIKSAKRAVKAIIGNADVTDEELKTAFVNAEGIINSRPLCYQGNDVSDEPPLTPNHFLFGQAGGQLAPESVDNTPSNPKYRWRRVQELVCHFWKRWMQELILTLNSRKIWNKQFPDIKLDDIVLVIDQQTPRGK